MLAQRAMHLICTAAIKDDVFLAYLVAMPRQRFKCRNAFSIRRLSLYRYSSYECCSLRFFLGGITTPMPASSAFHNIISIITAIRKQTAGVYAVHKSLSLCTVSSGTFCNKYSDWHAMRIHGHAYLCIEPPFVRLISWLPPLAPAARG